MNISSIITNLQGAIEDCDRELEYTHQHFPVNGYNLKDWGEMTAEEYAVMADTTSLEEWQKVLIFTLDKLNREVDEAVLSVCETLEQGDADCRSIARYLKHQPSRLRI